MLKLLIMKRIVQSVAVAVRAIRLMFSGTTGVLPISPMCVNSLRKLSPLKKNKKNIQSQ